MDYNYAFRAMLHASIVIILACIISVIVLYILKAIGLMKIADKLGTPNSWLAFIPVANMYLLGKMAFKEAWLTWTLVILDIINFASPFAKPFWTGNTLIIVTATSIFSIILLILNYIALYKIYSKISDKAVVMLIFTVLTAGFIAPIFLFAIRNNPLKEQVAK